MDDNVCFTVTEICNHIGQTIKEGIPIYIKVRGEISNVKISRGNLYMTLKDITSNINVVQWGFKGDELKQGDLIMASGRISTFKKTSTYQLLANVIEKVGAGEAYAKQLLIKEKYEKLGYFDPKIKKPLPEHVENIGIVSASAGAAIKDILHVLDKNGFSGNVVLKGCYVQGEKCPSSVMKCIEELNQYKHNGKKLDVIVVTRGGGSTLDLIGFSDPLVLEAIFKSDICIISAVGHEIDNMLSDLVADIRAATPSIAGEVISSHQCQVKQNIMDVNNNLDKIHRNKIIHRLDKYEMKLRDIEKNIIKHAQESKQTTISDLIQKDNAINNDLVHMLNYYKNRLESYADKLASVNPTNILKQGYSVIYYDNNIIKSVKDLPKTGKLKIILEDGSTNVHIHE